MNLYDTPELGIQSNSLSAMPQTMDAPEPGLEFATPEQADERGLSKWVDSSGVQVKRATAAAPSDSEVVGPQDKQVTDPASVQTVPVDYTDRYGALDKLSMNITQKYAQKKAQAYSLGDPKLIKAAMDAIDLDFMNATAVIKQKQLEVGGQEYFELPDDVKAKVNRAVDLGETAKSAMFNFKKSQEIEKSAAEIVAQGGYNLDTLQVDPAKQQELHNRLFGSEVVDKDGNKVLNDDGSVKRKNDGIITQNKFGAYTISNQIAFDTLQNEAKKTVTIAMSARSKTAEELQAEKASKALDSMDKEANSLMSNISRYDSRIESRIKELGGLDDGTDAELNKLRREKSVYNTQLEAISNQSRTLKFGKGTIEDAADEETFNNVQQTNAAKWNKGIQEFTAALNDPKATRESMHNQMTMLNDKFIKAANDTGTPAKKFNTLEEAVASVMPLRKGTLVPAIVAGHPRILKAPGIDAIKQNAVAAENVDEEIKKLQSIADKSTKTLTSKIRGDSELEKLISNPATTAMLAQPAALYIWNKLTQSAKIDPQLRKDIETEIQNNAEIHSRLADLVTVKTAKDFLKKVEAPKARPKTTQEMPDITGKPLDGRRSYLESFQ